MPKGLAADDIVVLASFPRSGNTLLRFLLANALKRDENLPVDYQQLDKLMPTAFDTRYLNADATRSALIPGCPLVIKEHLAYPDMPGYRYRRAVYLYRNRADALKSYWAFVQKRNPGMYPDVRTYLKYYGHIYRTWDDHVDSWLQASKNERHDIRIIRYEDLMADKAATLKSVIEFLGCQVAPERISRAIEASSYDRIKALNTGGLRDHIIPGESISRDVFECNDECPSEFKTRVMGTFYFGKWLAKRWVGRVFSGNRQAAGTDG